jgi:ribonuclease P protein component
VKRRFRLTSSKDFQRVRSFGKAVRHRFIVIVYLPNETGTTRIGVIAGKPVGKAVQRNRAKRLIRSALQPYLKEIPAGWDALLIARKSILEADFQCIQEAIEMLLASSLLIKENDERQS